MPLPTRSQQLDWMNKWFWYIWPVLIALGIYGVVLSINNNTNLGFWFTIPGALWGLNWIRVRL